MERLCWGLLGLSLSSRRTKQVCCSALTLHSCRIPGCVYPTHPPLVSSQLRWTLRSVWPARGGSFRRSWVWTSEPLSAWTQRNCLTTRTWTTPVSPADLEPMEARQQENPVPVTTRWVLVPRLLGFFAHQMSLCLCGHEHVTDFSCFIRCFIRSIADKV